MSASKIHTQGPWQLMYKATGVLCPDGRRRTVRLHHTADTFFSVRAKLPYRGTTVTGIVMHDGADTDEGLDLRFYPQGKNAAIFERGESNGDREDSTGA